MNVYRHAFARHVSVSLGLKDEVLTLEIRDDGIGVDGIERLENGGVGVASMKSRMEGVDGDLSLDHQGPGFAVIAQARIPAPAIARPKARTVKTPRGPAKATPRRSPPPRSKAS